MAKKANKRYTIYRYNKPTLKHQIWDISIIEDNKTGEVLFSELHWVTKNVRIIKDVERLITQKQADAYKVKNAEHFVEIRQEDTYEPFDKFRTSQKPEAIKKPVDKSFDKEEFDELLLLARKYVVGSTFNVFNKVLGRKAGSIEILSIEVAKNDYGYDPPLFRLVIESGDSHLLSQRQMKTLITKGKVDSRGFVYTHKNL